MPEYIVKGKFAVKFISAKSEVDAMGKMVRHFKSCGIPESEYKVEEVKAA